MFSEVNEMKKDYSEKGRKSRLKRTKVIQKIVGFCILIAMILFFSIDWGTLICG